MQFFFALLEALDNKQNNAFLDDFIDVPFDLSKVLFVCTANTTATIPKPLLDRMEIIHVNGYVDIEKFEIAKKFLIPKLVEDVGFKDKILISDSVLNIIIQKYCREPGIRTLKKILSRMFEKSSLNILQGATQISITQENLSTYLDNPEEDISNVKYIEEMNPGVALCLFSNFGGSIGYIESVIDHKKTEEKAVLTISGKLDEMMEESTDIAYTVAKNFLNIIDPNNKLLNESGVHMHLPSGALSKEGTSAGCAMVTSLLSLALKKRMKKKISLLLAK